MKKEITLKLRASNFKDTVFNPSKCGCAIEKAAMKLFRLPKPQVCEGIVCLSIKGKWYKHEAYMQKDFISDMELAKKYNFNNRIIRKILLTKSK